MIGNISEIEGEIRRKLTSHLKAAMEEEVRAIVLELPNGYNSNIADKLTVRQEGSTIEVWASDIWTYLNDGTGIYGPHKGKGPGGEIVPVRARALHFRSKKIAQALGFRDENVYLQKVKGVPPRFYWDRHFSPQRISDALARA